LAVLEQGADPLRRQQLEAAVELAQSNLDEARGNLTQLGQGPAPLERQQSAAEVDLAQATLAKAEADLAKLEEGLDPLRLQQSGAAVDLASAKLAVAEESLAEFGAGAGTATGEGNPAAGAGIDPLELAAREAEVALTAANLVEVEDKLAELEAGLDPLTLAVSEALVSLARATLGQAEEDLAELLQDPDPAELALKVKQVDSAQAALAQAEDDLAELLRGPDPANLALQEAVIASARLAAAEALRQVDGASLKAPMDGFISVVHVEEGDDVNRNSPILEIVDSSVVEVDGIVDEIDVRLVQVGAQAVVSMDAFPGQTLEGIISEIAPAALNQQGVVTYPIRVQMKVPEGMQIREGLSAVANIILSQESDVLRVPQQALYGSFEAPVVRVMTSSGIQERTVVLGSSDDFWTAVREGLAEGDQVVMEVTQAASDPFAAFRQLRGGFGGGGGGGIGRGGR
jgi:RND family efflux transporter MFP subunit